MNTKEKDLIGFKLVKITTEQFAEFEEYYISDNEIGFQTNLSFGVDSETKYVGVFPAFTFLSDDKPFLKIKAGCHFQISNTAWDSMLNEDEKTLIIPSKLLRHLSMITIGTVRGILHSETENTKFNNFFIPLINVEEMITEDLIISLEENTKNL